jgi:hypothetical protein
MNTFYMLEWTYSPPDYFEAPIQISHDQYVMTIENGKVEAKVNDVIYEENPEMRNQLHEALNDRFIYKQVFNHQLFELSKPQVCKIHPDGRKDHFIFLETAEIICTGELVDLVLMDKDGNIVGDTRRNRIDREKSNAELLEKHRANSVLKAILHSNQTSIMDPNNELIHLYEIRDALIDEFGRESEVKMKLGISSREWRNFGRLANDAPLKQGRHRGKHVGELRDATHEELNKAREFARTLILSYLEYLEHKVY